VLFTADEEIRPVSVTCAQFLCRRAAKACNDLHKPLIQNLLLSFTAGAGRTIWYPLHKSDASLRGSVPSRQEVQWSQLKVGVLIIVALAAVVALIFLMSGNRGGFFTGKITVRSYFENSAGLKVGAPVNLDGVTIGNVKAIHIVSEPRLTPVEVIMGVSDQYRNKLFTDSRTSLTTVGVLGDTVVDIDNRQAHGQPVQNNAVLPTNETPNLQDVIQSSQTTIQKLNTILDQLSLLVDKLNSNQGSIGKLINDPTLYDRAVTAVNQLSSIAKQINSGKGTIGKLMTDDSLYNHLNDSATKLDNVATEINGGKGTLGKLIWDPTLYDNLEKSSTQLNQVLAKANNGHGAVGMLLNDPAFAKKLNDTVTQLNAILAQANEGKGTIGQLIKNPALYDHLDEVSVSSSELVTAIRKNPKKYLSIKLHIF
jgi:phospholipid/cholesterol/gamma-HCH transport system substrate-binding protein